MYCFEFPIEWALVFIEESDSGCIDKLNKKMYDIKNKFILSCIFFEWKWHWILV